MTAAEPARLTTRPADGRSSARTVRASPRRSRAAWIPKQHGAWAMLVVPFVVGSLHGGLAWPQVPLLVSWVVGYMAFATAGLWLRSRRKPVYRAPMFTYGAMCLIAGLVLVAMRPPVLLWGLVFAPFAAASLWFSWRRADRAIANDVLTIVAACLIAPVAASAGAHVAAGPGAGLAPVTRVVSDPALLGKTAALVTYFVGTSLYVKTLIRERRSAGYRRASIAYHGLATVLWAVVPFVIPAVPAVAHVLLVVFFAVTAVRAALLAGHRVRPMHAGLGELALSAVLTLVLVLTW